MIDFPAPARVHSDGLATELAAVGLDVDMLDVVVAGDRVQIASLNESHRPVAGPVVAAHAGQPPLAEQQRVARAGDATDAIDALIAQAGGPGAVRAKLRSVVAGTDSFANNQQVQRVVAALALVVLRDRADT